MVAAECELSVDVWDHSNREAAPVCIKRVVVLPIPPFPKLKVKVARSGSLEISERQRYSYLFRSITHKTGIFEVQSVMAHDGGGITLSTGIAESSAIAVDLAVEYYCEYFGFKRLI